MLAKIHHLTVVLLFLLAAYGWGRLVRGFLDRRILLFHSLTAMVGIAVLSLVGGWLNLLHAAKPLVLLFLAGVGVVAGGLEMARWKCWRQRNFSPASIPLFFAPVFGVMAGLTLMPAGLFNIADDFHTYVPRAVRMAQTGTLAGNAFDSLGLDSLGSPSFFHSLFLSAGGVELLNGFDAVACFALCLLLVAELSMRWRLPWPLGIAAFLCFVWINPQYVNISPLYSGAAAVMALTVCAMFLAQSLRRRVSGIPWKLVLPTGLLAAWLVAMKVTLGLVAGILLVCFWLILLVAAPNFRVTLKTAAATALTTLACAMSWVLVALPALLAARGQAGQFAGADLGSKYPDMAARDTRYLFDPIALFYGDTPVIYLAIAGLGLAMGISGLACWWRRRADARLSAMPALAAAGISMMAALFINSHLFTISAAIRYSCPVLIGAAVLLVLGYVRARTHSLSPSRRWMSAALIGCAALLIGFFNGTLLERIDTAVRDRTLLAYRVDRNYRLFCREMLGPERAAYHRALQTNLPSHATAFVWTVTPFHFDFERNRLLTVTVVGISNPALRFPAGLPAEELEQYLRRFGVQFVVLQTRGYGVVGDANLAPMHRSPYALYRKIGDFGAYLRRSLEILATRRRVTYSDDHMLIFELGPDRQNPASSDRATAQAGARTALSARTSATATTLAHKAFRAPFLNQAHDLLPR
ncbi:MAG TPA: hypothetical protein VFT34_09935 [Verrucomicrobiae bacterium]|nr:hypothetical protein [Verrucomicrobiae bacterium]